MKPILLISIIISCILPLQLQAATVSQSASGKVLLDVDRHGEAWYINPTDLRRYYLGRAKGAWEIMRGLGVGITTDNLNKIPQAGDTWSADGAVYADVVGKIVLAVEQHGEAWYVNPGDGKRYYLGRPNDAWQVMTQHSVGIHHSDLQQLLPNLQIIFIDNNTIELLNGGSTTLGLHSKHLRDAVGHHYRWPAGQDLAPGKTTSLSAVSAGLQIVDGQTIQLVGKRRSPLDSATFHTLPNNWLLDVPFSSQAPYRNWVLPFSEACEETVLIMSSYYFTGEALSPAQVSNDILGMVDWELDHFGHHIDTSATDTATLGRAWFGLPTTISYDVTAEHIKYELRQGRVVALPVSGRDIGSPYFLTPGPLYHMELIIGYDGSDFITNDPGTASGKQERFPTDVLIAAAHDLTSPASNIRNGTPVLLIIGY